MRKTIDQQITVKKDSVLVCDKCKKEYNYDTESEMDLFEIQEFLHIDFIGGFFSVFGDGLRIKADICQYCLYEMIKDFVTVSQYDPIFLSE